MGVISKDTQERALGSLAQAIFRADVNHKAAASIPIAGLSDKAEELLETDVKAILEANAIDPVDMVILLARQKAGLV